MDENLERRARAQCRADIGPAVPSRRRRDIAVERYWPVVAAEIMVAGSVVGTIELPTDFAVRDMEYRELRNAPQSRKF